MSERDAYLHHLLGWGLPALALQVAVLFARDGRATFATVRAVAPAVLGVSLWLAAADALAVAAGIWRVDPVLTVGLRVVGLPLEEVLFFLLSNTLVAGGVVLCGGGGRV